MPDDCGCNNKKAKKSRQRGNMVRKGRRLPAAERLSDRMNEVKGANRYAFYQ